MVVTRTIFLELTKPSWAKGSHIMTAKVRSTAAERMRHYRERRRSGFYCIPVLIHEMEIDVLVHRGFLRADRRLNKRAVEHALNQFICRELKSEKS